MEYVYWIHRHQHTDPYVDGYVGISCNPASRFSRHRTSTQNPHLARALKMYDDIVFDIIHECVTREEAVQLEISYRPTKDIGWNLNIGGDDPPRGHLDDPAVKMKISNSHKNRGTNPYSPNTHSPGAIAKRKAAMAGRKFFYNPITGEVIRTTECPEGWLPGRKPKKVECKKIRGQDYNCNVSQWIVVDPQGQSHTVNNLKLWCEERQVPYLRVYQSQCGWSAQKINK